MEDHGFFYYKKDKRKEEMMDKYRVDCTNPECPWTGYSYDCTHSEDDELLCPQCGVIVEPVED